MTEEQKPRRVSAVRLALAVKRLRAETAGIDLLASEPIAVVGMGCRFPGGADGPAEYWELLRAGVDAIRRLPDGRWPEAQYQGAEFPEHLRYGGFLEGIDEFDAAFFGITPREAQSMDPQQRLLLEVTWEALWNAGIRPEGMSGGPVGVFTAISNTDYSRMELNRTGLEKAQENAPNAVHAAHSVAAGRVSFLLNLRGPCLAVDTACSSSLVALHLACQSLRARECDTALAGGVSLKVLPDELLLLDRLGVMSKTSRCRTFDAKADGFVVGEGCGVVVLKRLADALTEGDPIRAVIRGTAVNHDGRTTVMTAPSGLAHEAVIRQALKNGAVAAEDVGYVETHGTATSLGDPIELQALASVYGAVKSEGGECVLGAVKTNLGHLEAAAGMAGLIKVVIALEHGAIPANLHFETLNPQSSITETRLKIATSETAWPRANEARLAGVSSLGLNGTNGHVVVEEAPLLKAVARSPLPVYAWQRRAYWLPQLARTEARTGPVMVMEVRSPTAAPTTLQTTAPTIGRSDRLDGTEWTIASIESQIRREMAAVMEIAAEELAVDVPLINLGMDSMMALDLRQRVQALIGQELPNNFAFEHPSIADIAREIAARLWAMGEEDTSLRARGWIADGEAEEVEI
jgi:acyl transferase domain-containing protein/acyl carrier protein